MFDKVLLISEGYPVYCGKAKESIVYFSSLRFSPEIAMNPAEFLLDLATGQVNDISVPEDLPAPQSTSEYEGVIIRVSFSFSTSSLILFVIFDYELFLSYSHSHHCFRYNSICSRNTRLN